MPNPIPSEVAAITDPDLQTVEDWKRRTEAAKDLLIQRHGYKPDDFYTVSENDEPCLDGWSKYPAEWVERSGFVADSAIPRGLVIHCPPGVDVTGEAHSEHDPIYLLADCEWWASQTDDEMRALCNAPVQSN